MSVIDDTIPERAGQLVLDETAFTSLGTLAKQGVISLRHMDIGALPENLRKYESITAIGTQLGAIGNAILFWQGDWLIWVEEHMPEQFAQAQAEMGLSEQACIDRISVCRGVPADERRNSLSFSMHKAVSKLPARERKRWLNLAESKGLSTAELRERMKAKRRDERPELPGAGDDAHGPVDTKRVVEVAKNMLHAALPADDGQHHLVRNEDVAQLRGALGEEE